VSKFLKSLMRDELREKLDGADSGVFIRTKGLNSEKTYGFRAALQAQGLKYTVLRNALALQAFSELGYPPDAFEKAGVFDGPVGVVYSKTAEDGALLSAKTIAAWKRDNKDKVIKWAGAYMDGAVLDAKDAQALKDAPGKDEARGMLAGVLLAPVTQLMGTINEPAMRLLYALDAKKRKMEDEGGEAA